MLTYLKRAIDHKATLQFDFIFEIFAGSQSGGGADGNHLKQKSKKLTLTSETIQECLLEMLIPQIFFLTHTNTAASVCSLQTRPGLLGLGTVWI